MSRSAAAASISEFVKLIVSAAWEFFVGSSAAAASVAEFAKLRKTAAWAGAIEGFYMRDMEDCFFALVVSVLTLRSGFFEFLTLVSGYKGPWVDVEKGPQAAAALDFVGESFQVTSRSLFQKHPNFLFGKRKEVARGTFRPFRDNGLVLVVCGQGAGRLRARAFVAERHVPIPLCPLVRCRTFLVLVGRRVNKGIQEGFQEMRQVDVPRRGAPASSLFCSTSFFGVHG